QFAFTQGSGGVPQRLLNVLAFQVRIGGQNFVFVHAVSDHSNDRCHWNAQSPYAGDAAHLLSVCGDPCESHGSSSRRKRRLFTKTARPRTYTIDVELATTK